MKNSLNTGRREENLIIASTRTDTKYEKSGLNAREFFRIGKYYTFYQRFLDIINFSEFVNHYKNDAHMHIDI